MFTGRKRSKISVPDKNKLERARQLRDVHSDRNNEVKVPRFFAKFWFWKLREWNSKQKSQKRVKDEQSITQFALRTRQARLEQKFCRGREETHWSLHETRTFRIFVDFGYGKYLIVPVWYALAAYQVRFVSPLVFWLDCVSPKYEPWLDQTRLICHRRVPKRYDKV